MSETSTIAALSTPSGSSALAVLRVSGPLSGKIAKAAFGKANLTPRKAFLGEYRALSGKILDECMWTFFAGPSSYTGEDSLELCCHGNPFICRRIIEDLLARGCKMAQPGEFTRRAFLNGKMDLSQAEAVSDVITANSERSYEAARKLLSGELGRRISVWNDEILNLLAETETQIDFSEEEIPEQDTEEFRKKISDLIFDLKKTEESSRYSSRIHEGVNVVIFGAPNAGKSSLMNAVLGTERALVSSEAGTTRDFISETVCIGSHTIRLIDTAGVRDDADSEIEKSGIKRTSECVENADFLVFVVDVSEPPPTLSEVLKNKMSSENILIVFNKNDKKSYFNTNEFMPEFSRVSLSLLDSASSEIFKNKLLEILESKKIVPAEDILVVSVRHAEAIRKAKAELFEAAELAGTVSAEFVSVKLRNALEELSEILGKFDNEKVLDKVFSSFCIGK